MALVPINLVGFSPEEQVFLGNSESFQRGLIENSPVVDNLIEQLQNTLVTGSGMGRISVRAIRPFLQNMGRENFDLVRELLIGNQEAIQPLVNALVPFRERGRIPPIRQMVQILTNTANEIINSGQIRGLRQGGRMTARATRNLAATLFKFMAYSVGLGSAATQVPIIGPMVSELFKIIKEEVGEPIFKNILGNLRVQAGSLSSRVLEYFVGEAIDEEGNLIGDGVGDTTLPDDKKRFFLSVMINPEGRPQIVKHTEELPRGQIVPSRILERISAFSKQAGAEISQKLAGFTQTQLNQAIGPFGESIAQEIIDSGEVEKKGQEAGLVLGKKVGSIIERMVNKMGKTEEKLYAKINEMLQFFDIEIEGKVINIDTVEEVERKFLELEDAKAEQLKQKEKKQTVGELFGSAPSPSPKIGEKATPTPSGRRPGGAPSFTPFPGFASITMSGSMSKPSRPTPSKSGLMPVDTPRPTPTPLPTSTLTPAPQPTSTVQPPPANSVFESKRRKLEEARRVLQNTRNSLTRARKDIVKKGISDEQIVKLRDKIESLETKRDKQTEARDKLTGRSPTDKQLINLKKARKALKQKRDAMIKREVLLEELLEVNEDLELAEELEIRAAQKIRAVRMFAAGSVEKLESIEKEQKNRIDDLQKRFDRLNKESKDRRDARNVAKEKVARDRREADQKERLKLESERMKAEIKRITGLRKLTKPVLLSLISESKERKLRKRLAKLKEERLLKRIRKVRKKPQATTQKERIKKKPSPKRKAKAKAKEPKRTKKQLTADQKRIKKQEAKDKRQDARIAKLKKEIEKLERF